MFSRSLVASRQGIARVARQHAFIAQRTLVTTTVRQADLVQEMYLRELRNYKPPQVKASDAEGHVQKFSAPRAPTSPEDGDIAKDLSAYESQEVEVEGQSAGGASSAETHDWFEEEDYDDDKQDPAHH